LHRWPPRRLKAARLVDLVPLVRRLAPDVVHFHSAQPHGEVIAGLRLLRRGRRPLLVATPHSSRPYAKRRARLGLRAADLVLAPSAWAAEHARAAGARRVEVVPAGIQLGPEPDCEARDRVVLALGRLAAVKGFDVLIEAFELAARTRPSWTLWIAGEGSERDALVRRAQARAVRDRIHLLGWVGGAAKRDALARAAIGVLASRRESFGGALLEMLAAGLACIATDSGGTHELADAGRAARLVPPGDADALARALGALMDDCDARLALARAGREHARCFAWSEVAARLERVYRTPCGAAW
jgi:glycosyltransferase involved in cell wall biosynthesis